MNLALIFDMNSMNFARSINAIRAFTSIQGMCTGDILMVIIIEMGISDFWAAISQNDIN